MKNDSLSYNKLDIIEMATSLKGATSITDFKMENILENFAFT